MSRTRPPNPRELSRLQNHCTFLIPRTRTFLSPAINNHLPCKPDNHNLAHSRLLHTTSSRSAARPAPSTRKKAFQIKDTGRPGSLGHRLSKSPPEEDIPSRNSVAEAQAQLQAHLQTLEKNAFPLVSIMLRDGVLDKNVTPKKFKRIGATLLRNLYTLNTISPDVIRNIARDEDVDLDTILDIGFVIVRGNAGAIKLVIASCFRAGSLAALLIVAARALQACHGGGNVYNATTVRKPSSDTSLSRIAAIAQSKSEPHNSDPRVKLLYAKYLGLYGKYEQGIALVQEVLPLIEPSRVYRKSTLNITNLLEPPWQLLAWLKRELRWAQIRGGERGRGDKKGEANDVLSQEEVDALRLGAVEYQDPIALMQYARYMGEESGIQEYETYMGQAAAAGEKDACRKLANFYYLISVGKYPQLGTRDAKSTKLQATAEITTGDIDSTETENSKGALSTLLSHFGPRPLHEYRALAMEWYHVALAQDCFGSGLHLSLLHGQDGNHEAARAVFQEVEERADPSKMTDSAQKLMAALREGTNVPVGLPLDV